MELVVVRVNILQKTSKNVTIEPIAENVYEVKR